MCKANIYISILSKSLYGNKIEVYKCFHSIETPLVISTVALSPMVESLMIGVIIYAVRNVNNQKLIGSIINSRI